MTRMACLLLLTLLAPRWAQATPVWTDATQARALIEAVTVDAAGRPDAVSQLAGILQLDGVDLAKPDVVRPPFAVGPAGKLVSTELQLAMTQL